MRLLLDTHILVHWVEESGKLSRNQARAIRQATAPGTTNGPLLASDISLWEIATLWRSKRLRIKGSLRDWLERLTAPPWVERVGISPAIAAEESTLPDTFLLDPVDRLLVATARVHRATLVTSDRRILESGLVDTLG